MSSLQEARKTWGHLSDKDFDALIWTCTAFPCDTPEREAEILIQLHKRHDGDAGAAMKESMDEFDRAWEEHKQRNSK